VSTSNSSRSALPPSAHCAADTVIPDIKSFRDHAKRSTITADDVKLLARRDASVQAQLTGVEEALLASKKAKKRPRSEP